MKHYLARGMTLVELLVAMAIGLGITLAITSLLIAGENHKRTTTSTNDVEQSGSYSFYAMEKVLRGAGSAIAESAYLVDKGVLGCRLNVANFLPRPGAFPAPFNTAALTAMGASLRVAPLLIAPGATAGGKSDALIVMGGSGSAGGVSRQVTVAGGATSVVMDNIVGFAKNDLILVSQSGITDCLLEQVTDVTAPPTLALASTGMYYDIGTPTTLASLTSSTQSYVTPLGNADANNLQFQMFGVDTKRTLYSYDLLQNLNWYQGSAVGDTAQGIAEGVDQIHAIYGIDTPPGDGIQDTWADPNVAPYGLAAVMASPTIMKSIVSVRVAIVMRSEYYDKNQVSPATLTYFSGLTKSDGTALPALAQTINLAATTDQHYRYRVFEFTVPLRNMLLLAGGP